jgi:hypothetical protein
MPDPFDAPQPEYTVQISHQPHAFLVTNASVHDLGSDRRVDVGLGGVRFNAVASDEAVRAAANLTGLWRATVFIRTRDDGSLERITQVKRLRPIPTGAPQAAFWTATGVVSRVDRDRETLELGVRIGRGEGFTLHARGDDRQLNAALVIAFSGRLVHVKGTLEGLALRVNSLEARGTLSLPADTASSADDAKADGDG